MSTEDLGINLDELEFATKHHPTVNNVAIIVKALEELRGVQHFDRIVTRAKIIRRNKFPNVEIPRKFESVVSSVLQTHTKGVRSYDGKHDYFIHPERGYWGLRSGVHTDINEEVAIV